MAESIKAVKEALLAVITSKPVAYYSAFAQVSGGVTSGVLLSQLFYWTGRGADPDGWVYKSQSKWEAETGLTRREQETARKRLRERGILEEKLAGVPATLHYRVDLDRLIDLLCQTRLADSAKLEGREAPNKDGGNEQASGADSAELSHRLPQSTAESEAESTAEAAAGPENVVICSIHNVEMQRKSKDGESWYSHRLPDGGWCRGAAGDVQRTQDDAAARRRYIEGEYAELIQY
jgi:hypothetical protein